MGERFTSLGVDTSVGAFFEAMYQAALFLPILVNVVVITIAIDFKGTPMVTVAMLLANLWLLAWHWPQWRAVLISRPEQPVLRGFTRLERAGWLLGAASVAAFFFAVRGVALKGTAGALIVLGVLGGLMVVTAWVRGARGR